MKRSEAITLHAYGKKGNVQFTDMHLPVLQTLECLLGSRQDYATLVPHRLWAHGFQTVSDGPGPWRAFT